jgi:hypothetical protein
MDSAIRVNSIREEYDYIASQQCKCGGAWEKQRQALVFDDAKVPFDQISVRCRSCSSENEFWFNCSAFFGKPFWE